MDSIQVVMSAKPGMAVWPAVPVDVANPGMALDPNPEPGAIMPKPVWEEETFGSVEFEPAPEPKDPIMGPNEAVWAKALAASSNMAEQRATANRRFIRQLLVVRG